jgi:membrane protein required for colicin V production
MEISNINVNLFDIILLIGTIISFLIGYSRGFIKETLSIINWLLAAWLSFVFYHNLKVFIINHVSSPIIADAISFGVLFLLSIISLTIISNFISKNIKKSVLGPLDRVLGMIFGLIRAGLLIIIIIISGNQTIWINNTTPPWIYKSSSYPIIISTTNNLKKILPNEFFSIDIESINIKQLNLNNLIDKEELFNEPIVNKNNENESSYTPAEIEQMNRLNNIEAIDNEDNN